MAAYSDLIVTPAYSIATDGGSFTVTDNTGTYPTEPGGYAPTGQGTATRPAENQIQKWVIWRYWPAGELTEYYPDPQLALPATFSALTPGGVPQPDSVRQVLLLIVPSAAVYATVLQDAQTSGDPWTYFVEYAQTNGAVGQVAAVLNAYTANCTYDALRRFNNAQMGGSKECNPQEYATKKGLQQGIASNAGVAQATTLLTETEVERYLATQKVIDAAIQVCNDPNCLCNC